MSEEWGCAYSSSFDLYNDIAKIFFFIIREIVNEFVFFVRISMHVAFDCLRYLTGQIANKKPE